MIIHTTPPIERMLKRKIVDADGCWTWVGTLSGQRGTNNGGYGCIRAEKRGPQLMVHRVSFEHFIGPIPDGYQVEHVCHTADPDCPGGRCKHRACWNPDHLALLTHGENSKLGRSRAMETYRSGVCQRNHVLAEVGTYDWVRPSGTIRRACAECARESLRRRRSVRKAA